MTEKNGASGKDDFHYGRTLHMLSNRLRRLGDENLARHSITFSQLKILSYVSRYSGEGEVLQRDLEEAFEVRRSSITSILQNMEKSGILVRENCQKDARTKKILLTEKGKELEISLQSYVPYMESIVQKGFSEEEKAEFGRLLKKALQNVIELEDSEVKNQSERDNV